MFNVTGLTACAVGCINDEGFVAQTYH